MLSCRVCLSGVHIMLILAIGWVSLKLSLSPFFSLISRSWLNKSLFFPADFAVCGSVTFTTISATVVIAATAAALLCSLLSASVQFVTKYLVCSQDAILHICFLLQQPAWPYLITSVLSLPILHSLFLFSFFFSSYSLQLK